MQMYEKLPPHLLDQETLTPAEIKRLRRHVERPVRFARAMTKLSAVALTGMLVLQSDIAWNKNELSDSHPIIHKISAAADAQYDDRGMTFIDGFAGQDGSYFANKLTDPMQAAYDSDIYAVEYDKQGINYAALARGIAERAEQDSLTTMSLYGYSIGGTVATRIAQILMEEYNITVPVIFLDHTPFDSDSIRPKVRSNASVAIDIISLSNDLGIDIQYSSIARSVVETAIPGDLSYLKNSTTALMRSQYTIGVSANNKKNIESLQTEMHPDPVIVYVTSADPSTDYMVDVERSTEKYQVVTDNAGLSYIVVAVDGAIHSRPDLTIPAYEDALASIHSYIASETEKANRRYELLSGSPIRFLVKFT